MSVKPSVVHSATHVYDELEEKFPLMMSFIKRIRTTTTTSSNTSNSSIMSTTTTTTKGCNCKVNMSDFVSENIPWSPNYILFTIKVLFRFLNTSFSSSPPRCPYYLNSILHARRKTFLIYKRKDESLTVYAFRVLMTKPINHSYSDL